MSLRQLVIGFLTTAALVTAPAGADTCKGTVYLTLDTGNMAAANEIAGYLNKHRVKATFFLANEKTKQGGWSLGDEWGPYWKARVAEGHAFGSHTFDHVYIQSGPAITVRPQFGANAGKTLRWTAEQFCAELKRVETRFTQLTGSRLDALWRAPAGRTTPDALAAARACGYPQHAGWAQAGFLGDELSSDRHPNDVLLKRALRDIRSGDILMAHLGIWSRKEPFAPMIDPLIEGLKARGFCFETLREHPDFRS
jgi:peptidoglycan/xylan/chitin deacetylase (PgdA/CDA1 family)